MTTTDLKDVTPYPSARVRVLEDDRPRFGTEGFYTRHYITGHVGLVMEFSRREGWTNWWWVKVRNLPPVEVRQHELVVQRENPPGRMFIDYCAVPDSIKHTDRSTLELAWTEPLLTYAPRYPQNLQFKRATVELTKYWCRLPFSGEMLFGWFGWHEESKTLVIGDFDRGRHRD